MRRYKPASQGVRTLTSYKDGGKRETRTGRLEETHLLRKWWVMGRMQPALQLKLAIQRPSAVLAKNPEGMLSAL
jgi:hypothetical protein